MFVSFTVHKYYQVQNTCGWWHCLWIHWGVRHRQFVFSQIHSEDRVNRLSCVRYAGHFVTSCLHLRAYHYFVPASYGIYWLHSCILEHFVASFVHLRAFRDFVPALRAFRDFHSCVLGHFVTSVLHLRAFRYFIPASEGWNCSTTWCSV
jgi:hypothetical protein